MTNDEAKFILNAYRPGGQDAGDPEMAGAIRQAQSDPSLQTWWARSQTFDGRIAARLREVAPPPGLREAILAGAELSRPRASRRPVAGWLALAAAIALLLGVAATGYYRQRAARAGLGSFAQFALADAGAPGHMGDPDPVLDHWLTTSSQPLDQGALPVDPARMQSDGCRSLSFHGVKVFEVCFNRAGVEYHLYLFPRSSSSGWDAGQTAEVSEPAGSAAAWADARYVYALATQAGTAVLRRAL